MHATYRTRFGPVVRTIQQQTLTMSNTLPQNNPNINNNVNRPIIGLNSLWNNHVQKIMIQKNIPWNEAMKEASKTYDEVKKKYKFENDVMTFYRKYIEVIKTNQTYDQLLPEIIAYLKDLRCNLKDEEKEIKEHTSDSLRYLRKKIIKLEHDLAHNGPIFKKIMQNEENKIKERKEITALWINYIRNERYTFFSRKWIRGKGRVMVYNVNHTLTPHLNYGEILDEVIWYFNYEWKKIIGERTMWMIFTYWVFYIIFCWKPQIMCFPIAFKHIKGWKKFALYPIGAIATTCRYIDKSMKKIVKNITGKRHW